MANRKLSLLVNFVGVDKMSGALRNIVGLGKKGGRSLKEMTGHGRKLESQLRDVRSQLAGTSGNVTQLIDRERQLERAIEGVNADLKEKKRLLAIEGDKRAMMRRGDQLKSRGRSNMVGGAAMLAPFILAGKASMDFSSGMVDIQQKANLTDAATRRVATSVLVLSRNAGQLPENMRAGLDALMAKGMQLAPAQEALGPIGRLSTAYKVDIPDAASAAYASISNLKVPASQTGRILDMMAAAGNEGAFEVRNMARHFPALTAQMQALGEKGAPAVADLSAALQVAMKTAGSEDEAGNNIKNLLAKINAPATIRAFQKNFGVNLPAAMAKLEKQGYSSMEAIALVTKQATGGDMKRLGFAFEDMQARQGVMALIQNLEEYRLIRDAAMSSDGTVDKAFEQRMQNDPAAKWQKAVGTFQAMAITLGNQLMPAATETLGMLTSLGGSVAAFAERNPNATALLMKTVAGLALFKIGLGAAQFAVGGLLGPLAKGIALWRQYRIVGSIAKLFPNAAIGVRALGIAFRFLLGPIGLAILVIGTLAFAVYKNWDKIKSAFTTGFAAIAGFGKKMWSLGKDMIAGLARGIAAAPGAVWNALKNVVMGGIGKVKKLLGINSPSRVFMAIGENTTEGLTRGIERNNGRPMRAMGRLATGLTAAGTLALTPVAASATTPSARAPVATAATAAGTTVNIYLQQQPGQSAKDMAREIRRELKNLDESDDRGSYDEGDG